MLMESLSKGEEDETKEEDEYKDSSSEGNGSQVCN